MFLTRKAADAAINQAAFGGTMLGMFGGVLSAAIPAIIRINELRRKLYGMQEEKFEAETVSRKLEMKIDELESYDVRTMSAGSLRHHLAERLVEEEDKKAREKRVDDYNRRLRKAAEPKDNGKDSEFSTRV